MKQATELNTAIPLSTLFNTLSFPVGVTPGVPNFHK